MGEVRIGVSSCLLGQEVRFDGGHKHDRFLTGELERFVSFVPMCPEVSAGLGTPRESLRLARRDGETRLVAPRSGRDHTEAMRGTARALAAQLEREDVSGYVLMGGSPTCGLERVRVYPEGEGAPARTGRGLFAEALAERLPLLPLEESGRLKDPRLRESFLVRVFAYRRVRDLFASDWRRRDLIRFHAGEKLRLLAQDPHTARRLGRVVAAAATSPRDEVARRYTELHSVALRRVPAAGGHANALEHALGHLGAPADDRRELVETIGDYRRGVVPLAVPFALLRHHVRRGGTDWVRAQAYLSPHPPELGLRSRV